MRKRTRRLGTLVAFAVAPLALSCRDDVTAPSEGVRATPQAEVRMSVEPEHVTLRVGESVRLNAVMTDGDGRQLEFDDESIFSWSSSRPDVVDVDETGVLEAIAVGSATVTAGCSEHCAFASVTVILR